MQCGIERKHDLKSTEMSGFTKNSFLNFVAAGGVVFHKYILIFLTVTLSEV